jgi:flagellar basal body rod protein FlgB
MRIDRYRTFWDTPTLQASERAMNRAVARHKLLAHNLANANTPRFVRWDLPEGEWTPAPSLQRALRAGVLPLRTTDPRHISLPPDGATAIHRPDAPANADAHRRQHD